jgi:hypothetical protein
MYLTCTLDKKQEVFRVLAEESLEWMKRWQIRFRWTLEDVNCSYIRSRGWFLFTPEILRPQGLFIGWLVLLSKLATLSILLCQLPYWTRAGARTKDSSHGNMLMVRHVTHLRIGDRWLWSIGTVVAGTSKTEKGLPQCQFCPQVPCELLGDWTQASVVRTLHIIAWVMVYICHVKRTSRF